MLCVTHHHVWRDREFAQPDAWYNTAVDSDRFAEIVIAYRRRDRRNHVLVCHGHRHSLTAGTFGDPDAPVAVVGLPSSTFGDKSHTGQLDGVLRYGVAGLRADGSWGVACTTSVRCARRRARAVATGRRRLRAHHCAPTRCDRLGRSPPCDALGVGHRLLASLAEIRDALDTDPMLGKISTAHLELLLARGPDDDLGKLFGDALQGMAQGARYGGIKAAHRMHSAASVLHRHPALSIARGQRRTIVGDLHVEGDVANAAS